MLLLLVQDKASMMRKIVTKEQKEAALVGRLDSQALRAALEDVLRWVMASISLHCIITHMLLKYYILFPLFTY